MQFSVWTLGLVFLIFPWARSAHASEELLPPLIQKTRVMGSELSVQAHAKSLTSGLGVQSSLQSPSDYLREKAAFATRFMPANPGVQLIEEAYLDSAERVKGAAVQALAFVPDRRPYQSVIEQCAKEGREPCQQMLRSW